MGWRHFFRRGQADREQLEEIESYIQLETEDNVARGMPPAEAAAAARRKFGNVTVVREEVYQMNTIAVVDTMGRDIRYGLRLLRRNPAFAATVLLTLAIGIGANTAVFSIVNSVLIKPLAYPEAGRLVAVRQNAPGAAGLGNVGGGLRLSASMYFTYAEQNRTLESMGVWTANTSNVTGVAEPERVPTVFVSDGVLEALKVPPVVGRWLAAGDQTPRGAASVMLGYGFWQRRFGGDPAVIGRSITVDARPAEIVGVMPEGFRLVNADFDLIRPLAFDRAGLILPGFGFEAIGRLKPGVTLAAANADLARLVPVWMRSWPAAPGANANLYETWRITPALRPLKEEVVGNVGSALWVVMGTIAMVLLIAAANVANLLLVRGEARQHELAVRAALGAGWGRILRELVLESVLLSLMGGVLGMGVAYAALRVIVALGPGNLPRLNEISLDTQALVFGFLVSLAAGVVFGLLTGLKYGGRRNGLAVRGGGRNSTATRQRHRARGILVVTQVALALVLLVSSGLMIRTFQKLRTVRPGFTEPETIQTVRLYIPSSLVKEPERVVRMQNDILEKLAAIPGVRAVGFASAVPMDGVNPGWDTILAEGREEQGTEMPPLRSFKEVSPGMFGVMGTRLAAGRDYTWTDLYDRRHVVMVSENLARELWGSADLAVGKRLRVTLPASPWQEVIGVVEDVHERGVQEAAPAIVYWPSFGWNKYFGKQLDVARAVTYTIRSPEAGSANLLGQIRQAVWALNASLPVAGAQTMQELYQRSLGRTSFTLVMLGVAASMALALGLIGIYGVISYAVAQRRREIGIRLALGARAQEVSRMFVRYGLVLTGIGAAIGLGVASVLTRLMETLLFGVSRLDPLTYLAVPAALMLAAACAAYVPARRAAAVDPVETLRAE